MKARCIALLNVYDLQVENVEFHAAAAMSKYIFLCLLPKFVRFISNFAHDGNNLDLKQDPTVL